MRIAVFGAETTGIVVSTCLAETGHDIKLVDADTERLKSISKGELPFFEPGLPELFERNQKAGRLKFVFEPTQAIKGAQIIFITTNALSVDGSMDTTDLLKTISELAPQVGKSTTIIIASTVPIGTHDKVKTIFYQVGVPVKVATCPVFLTEGKAIDSFMRPDRVVVGIDDPSTKVILEDLFRPYIRTGNPLLFMNPKSAELSKLATNAILASRVSFMNNLALLCDKADADISLVAKGTGSDSRIGRSYLFAGAGYGGRRLTSSVKELLRSGKKHGLDMAVINSIDQTNNQQHHVIPQRVKQRFGDNLQGKKIAIWGIAYKPRTDDIQHAPSQVIINDLLEAQATVCIYDPRAIQNAKKIWANRITYFDSQLEACKDADALVIITEWNEFRQVNLEKLKNNLKTPIVFDGRNLFNPQKMKESGFEYQGIGRR